ncbi:TPA: restriction endonuclease subunit S [Legionella anisa]
MSNKVYTSVKQNIRPKLRFPEFQAAQEWEIKLLGDLIYYGNGKAHEQNISDMGKYIVVNSKFISTEGEVKKFTNDGLCIANKGDILMVLSDVPNGKAIAKCFLVGRDELYTVNQRICLIKPKSSVSEFIYYIINRNPFYLNFDDGVKQTNLRKDDVLSCPIIVPSSKKEQQKIADCLSSIDELITAESKKLDILKACKKGLMQQLFPAEGETIPKLRFPEFQATHEWKIKQLGNCFCIGNGRDYKHLLKGNIPVYGTGGYMLSVDDYLHDGESVCIGRKGTIDKPMFLTGKFWTVDTLFYTHSFKECLPKFIYLIFQNIPWLNYNAASGVPSLSKTTIERIEISIPGLQEQQKIADFLFSIDTLIAMQNKKIDALKNHKKGLMQQLFPTMNELKG